MNPRVTKVWSAIAAVDRAWPWLGPTLAAIKWDISDDHRLPSSHGDGKVMLPTSAGPADVAREALHYMLAHYTRGVSKDQDTWWAAAKLSLELPMKDLRWCTVSRAGAQGLTAEEYYQDPGGEGEYGEGEDGGVAGDPAYAAAHSCPEGAAKDGAAMFDDARSAGLAKGDVPGWVVRQLPGTPPARRIRWYQILRRSLITELSKEGAETRDYGRLARLGACVSDGIILGRITGHRPNVCIAIDTSGSMGERELKFAAARVKEIVQSLNCDITVIAGDTQVASTGKARSMGRTWEPMGGGGTEFSPLIRWAEGQGYRSLVYITDGYGEGRVHQPRVMQLIWCVTPGGKKPASHGEVIQIEDGKKGRT